MTTDYFLLTVWTDFGIPSYRRYESAGEARARATYCARELGCPWWRLTNADGNNGRFIDGDLPPWLVLSADGKTTRYQ
jgi:hypothetical protein